MLHNDVPTRAERVAAIAGELGDAIGINRAERRDLFEAARWHEFPFLCKASGLERLAADLGVRLADSSSEHLANPRVKEILSGFHDRSRLRPQTERLVTLLRSAKRLEEELEWEPFKDESADEESFGQRLIDSALGLLQVSTRDELREAALSLPVFPSSHLEAVRILTAEDTEARDIEKVAGRDPVLAGALLRTANCALYRRRREVRSVPQAVNYIGPNLSRQVLLATLMRGVFEGPSLAKHWTHAVETAELAADLAAEVGVASPSEASLAGLVHDVGLLAIEFLSPGATARRERLIAGGVPMRGAEWIVFGFDHAEASAVVLSEWRFPAELIEAVRHHHTPDRAASPLASLLYLVEFLACSEEDYPSTARLEHAASCLRLNVASLMNHRNKNQLSSVLA